MKKSTFKKLLLANNSNSLQKQKEHLNATFETWKGDLEQIDDVCIIGVRV
jgi:serine phosphatase RsbU (regulator of sigma subunit)